MRVIKFRLWDVKGKAMFAVDELCFFDQNISEVGTDHDHYFEEDFTEGLAVLMQFTGLKDKHGKEIYEGDVVARQSTKGNSLLVVIEYSEKGACFMGRDMAKEGIALPLFYSIPIWKKEGFEIELLGNIYEHPDLLKAPDA